MALINCPASVEWLLTGEKQLHNTNVANVPMSSSSVIQGVNHSSVFVRNGSERTLSDEAMELLRNYETLDIKHRMDCLIRRSHLRMKQKKSTT